MSNRFESVCTTLMVGAALVIAVAVVRREFWPSAAPASVGVRAGPPVKVEGWESLGRLGTWIGDSTAKVRIVALSDYECPFCRRFDDRFREVRDSVGSSVAMLVIPFPLENHRFARPAALAAECAAREGRWEPFHFALFAKADSFGLKSWASYAHDAGIRDTLGFQKCVRSNTESTQLKAAVAEGQRLKLTGTPTVLIDGFRYPSPPHDSLLSIVRRRLSPGQ